MALDMEGDVATGGNHLEALLLSPGQARFNELGGEALATKCRWNTGVREHNAIRPRTGSQLVVEHADGRGRQRESLLVGFVPGCHSLATFNAMGWISTDALLVDT